MKKLRRTTERTARVKFSRNRTVRCTGHAERPDQYATFLWLRLAIRGIRLYQSVFATLTSGKCRFTPSCSEYAIGALEKHGLLRGSILAAKRILRCHWSMRKLDKSMGETWGYDPVPLRDIKKS
ncbi:MAG: membrane protein insertion efficiency factor YidD [Holosporales bacterium]|jgi:putative membrane protein insertion efficiency factor|nr:membrane protein insertion efficiency factor YidD [Holosporales bacterium]